MIHCKESVRFRVLTPELLRLLLVADRVFAQQGVDCIVTAGTDSHPPDDPHFNGYAADLRTHHITNNDTKHVIVAQMQTELGADYYVFLEAEGTDNEHIHGQVAKGLWQQLKAKEMQP